MQVTLEVPDELANKLESDRDALAEIIHRGLQRCWSETSGLGHEVIAFLASGPTPDQIVSFRPSDFFINRLRDLLARNRDGHLSASDVAELDEMAYLDHLMTLIKAAAHQHKTTSA